MSIAVANTSANLTGKTIMAAENAETVSGLKTFDRGGATAPFAVAAAAAGSKVTNLAAEFASAPLSGQFAFPAVQNPSAGANVLDDYEEGTFTPAISFGGASVGVTYSVQAGFYTKIGNLVYVEVRVTLTSKGSSVGAAAISQPFTVSNTPVGSPLDFAAAGAGITGYAFNIPNGTSLLLQQTTASARAALTDANFTNTTDVRMSATFRV